MFEEVLHMAHFLNRFVFVSLPYQDFSSVGGVMRMFTLYLCIVGKDLGAKNCISVIGSFNRGPNFLKACLTDLSLSFLAKVFARDSLRIHIRFRDSARFPAKE